MAWGVCAHTPLLPLLEQCDRLPPSLLPWVSSPKRTFAVVAASGKGSVRHQEMLLFFLKTQL